MTDETLNNDLTKLRFLDENGETYPDWEEKQLGEIAEKVKTRNKGMSFNNAFTNSATQGIISQRDYFDKYIAIKGNTENYYIINPETFLYNPRISKNAPCGPINMNKLGIAGIASPLYKAFQITSNDNKKYLDTFFRSNKWNNFMISVGNSGAREDRLNLSDKDFFKMPIQLPHLPEQTKIADFLSNLDERIEQQSNLVELLKKQKQGYSQRLFNGSLRFKKDDGTDYEDWEEKKLGELFSIPKKEESKEYDKILTVKLNKNGIIKSSNTSSLKKGSTKYYKRYAGQFIFGIQNLHYGALGIVPESLDGFISSSFVPSLNIDRKYLNSNYIEQFMGRKSYYSKLEKYAVGNASKLITEKTLLSLNIIIPSLPEQEKIAEFLSSLDNRIDEQLNKLEQLKSEKKAYMQKVLV